MIETFRRLLLPIEGGLLLLITPLLMFPNLDWNLSLVAVGLLLSWWLLEKLVGQIPLFPKSPFSPPLILWAVTIVIGVLVTADPDLTHPKALGLLLGFAYWRFLATAIRSERTLTLSVFFFMVVGLAMTGVGVISADWRDKVALLSSLLDLLPPQLVQLPGVSGNGIHTNELGGTIVIFLPLLLTITAGWRPVRKRPLLILALMGFGAVTTLVLLLTQSRSAWIGLAGSVMFLLAAWFLFLPPSRPKRITQIVIAIIALLLLVGLTQVDWNQIVSFIEEPPRNTAVGTFTTINFRRQLWQAATEVLEDTPFTGTGLGAFRRVVPRLYPISASDSNDVAHAHNIFLQVAVDTGFLGLIAYLSTLIIVAISSYRVALLKNEHKPLVIGLLAGLVGLHLFGLTDALAPGAKPAILFWINLGLITALYHINSTDEQPA